MGEPIPVCTSASIKRLATHYDVGFEQFKSLASHKLPSAKPSETYQASLANWQTAIVNAGQNQEGDLPDKLLLFNLRAGQYLTNTRTAAYLWVKENPGEAEQLISDKNYYELFLSQELADRFAYAGSNEPLLTYLADQVSDVSAINHGSQELFTTPQSSGCKENTAKLVRQLQDGLAEFIHGGEK